MNKNIKITFAMIVLNGEPFIRYNLRSLYPFAHEIIIVEGACRTAASIATPDGHSKDGTLEILKEFKSNEDPENKITIVTAAEEGYKDGFWPEKDEMCAAFAKRITGNYLWCVDHDEFYRKEDMEKTIKLLNGDYDELSFEALIYFGCSEYIIDGGIPQWDKELIRLFKWEKGYTFTSHRPPTVLDRTGLDLRRKRWLKARDLRKLGVFIYHYSLLFPKQAYEKVSYYKMPDPAKRKAGGGFRPRVELWYRDVYKTLRHPYHVFQDYDPICWLRRFRGSHPEQFMLMMNDIKTGVIDVELRKCNDIENILRSPLYCFSTVYIKTYHWLINTSAGKHIEYFFKLLPYVPNGIWKRIKRVLHK